MTDANSMTGKWTSTQAYVLSVICLLAGVAVGYLLRGSAPTQAAASSAAPLTAAAGTMPNSSAPQPSPEQLRQAADAQAQPLLAQLKGDPKNADLLYKIGNLYYDAQQYPDAVKYYESSVKINPNSTDVLTDLGTAYHLMGQPDQAIQEYDRALKVDPKHANALFNEGMVKWQDKMDINGAIASWKRLLEANPNYPQADRVRQLMERAQQHLNMQTGTPAGKSADAAK